MNLLIYNAIFILERVVIGSFEHLIPIFLGVLLCVIIIRLAKYKMLKKHQDIVFKGLGFLVFATVMCYNIYLIREDNYNLKTDLPLYLCSLMGFLIPVFTYYRRFWMFEILFFWIVVGVPQSVITPDIPEGFPSFNYFRFWILHLGLLIIIFYAVFVFNMKPKLKSVFKSLFALQGYVFIMILINYLLNANYFYLKEKPESASLLDYFGEWPYYIVVAQITIIPYFFLMYMPFYIIRRRELKKKKNERFKN